MKEYRSTSDDKLINVEDGLIPNGETSYVKRIAKSTNYCKQLVQCVKFLLYLELLLFAGWACYTAWQTYRAESMELKVTDDIRASESHTPLAEKFSNEEATTIPNDFLTKMDNLLQTENALEETLKQLEEQPTNDETDINFVKTTEEPVSETKRTEESDIKAEPFPLFESNVPKVMEVEVEKRLEDIESDESNSDPSKSEETVFLWNFGFLPFPNTYHIREQSAEESASSEEPVETEGCRERTERDKLVVAIMDLILKEAERTAQTSDNSKENTDPKIQDSMFSQSAELSGNSESFTATSQTKSDSEDWKDDSNVYDDIIISPSSPEDTNKEIIGDSGNMEEYRDLDMVYDFDYGKTDSMVSVPELELDLWTHGADEVLDLYGFTESELSGARSIDKRSIPDVTTNQQFTNTDEEYIKQLIQQYAIKSRLLRTHGADEVLDLYGLTGKELAGARSIDKRSIPMFQTYLKRYDDIDRVDFFPRLRIANKNFNKPETTETDNRVSNKGRSSEILSKIPVNTSIEKKNLASLLNNFIQEEENSLAQKVATVSGHEQQLLKNYLDNFYNKMEAMAAHIDKLHEQYLYLNQLNDDYISQEFP